MAQLKRQWKIHLVHHTHLDIGYTHTQDEVLKIQYKHLEKAMDLIEESSSNEEGTQFKWNPEITWALDTWVDQARPEQLSRFIGLVQEGSIGLDALYGNLLTGLCRPNELLASFRAMHKLEALTGVKIDSAMITDVPGWNHGLVDSLATNGVKYLSAGTNRSDRIGHILRAFADKPFYWLSSNGQHKVLTWVHGKGYSWFHTGMYNEKNLSKKLTPRRMSHYLKKLESSDYPYDTIIIRYNVGADNGPPDEHLSTIAKDWNLKYPHMQLNLSTTSEAMHDFEQHHGDQLPVHRGDITPYWEDGAASTSRETAIARDASERLGQLEVLQAMKSGQSIASEMASAYKQILLYNEHTWGAYNSISKPDHTFAKSLWSWKKDRASVGAHTSYTALDKLFSGKRLAPKSYDDLLTSAACGRAIDQITITNTQKWSVSQVMTISTEKAGIMDSHGQALPSQKLSTGELAFIIHDVPGKSQVTYSLTDDLYETNKQTDMADGFTFNNSQLSLTFDPMNGRLKSLKFANKEFIKPSNTETFNQYIFAEGKWGIIKHPQRPSKVDIKVLEDGPVLSRLQIQSSPYKTNKLTTTITINQLNERIYLENLLDRPLQRKKEGLHFEFPFNIPKGRVAYDTAFGHAVVDTDQLDGSNKNFITATRWVDISDDEVGISCSLLDAPIFKSGPLVKDPFRSGPPDLCGWKRKTNYNGTIYSYVMNNYWMTNYKADQPGETLFRYVFMPHESFDVVKTNQFALEEAQPLIVTSHDTQSMN